MEKTLEKTSEQPQEHDPAFSSDAFDILFFAPGGMEFETREVVGRTHGVDVSNFTDEQKELIREGVKTEVLFKGAESLRKVRKVWRDAIRNNEDPETIGAYQTAFEEAREAYHQKGYKIGASAVQFANGLVTAEVRSVPYPIYNLLASGETNEAERDFSAALGTAMVLETSDGKLVVQHRRVTRQSLSSDKPIRGNNSYADIPGASVAGMVDATASNDSQRRPGTPDAVDTAFLQENIAKELGEEIGLRRDQIDEIQLVGWARDKVKDHDEVLMLARTDLRADQLREASLASHLNKDQSDADFEEDWVTIESSPQAIEKLLTEVNCPLPSTHTAAFIAAGYSLMTRESGKEAADVWLGEMQSKVQAHYEAMDKMVADFYLLHPEAADQVPERLWGKTLAPLNKQGYDPSRTPGEQGLESMIDGMIRVGLLPETRTHIEQGYLFDVDGVITDPREKMVTDEMVDELVTRLEMGEPICFNTGRSTSWVNDELVARMRERLQDVSLLQKVVVIGEKGGTWTTFNEAGEQHDGKVASISIPDALKDAVRKLIAEKYADVMFLDESKQTMLSVEMNDGGNLQAFTESQREFASDLEELLRITTYRIDTTTIATDAEDPHMSKALGARRFLEWLAQNGIVVENFTAFGDSASDAAMADELARRGKNVEFVYVGKDVSSLEPKADYLVENYPGFNGGTLEYLGSR